MRLAARERFCLVRKYTTFITPWIICQSQSHQTKRMISTLSLLDHSRHQSRLPPSRGLAYLQRAGPVPGSHKICSPAVLPGHEIMEWNSGFPVKVQDIKSNSCQVENNGIQIWRFIFLILGIFAYSVVCQCMFYLCHVVNVLLWVEMPRAST